MWVGVPGVGPLLPGIATTPCAVSLTFPLCETAHGVVAIPRSKLPLARYRHDGQACTGTHAHMRNGCAALAPCPHAHAGPPRPPAPPRTQVLQRLCLREHFVRLAVLRQQ